MEQNIETTLNDERIYRFVAERLQKSATEFSQLDNACIYARLSREFKEPLSETNQNSFKVQGAILVLLEKGEADIEVNTQTYHIAAPAIISLTHGEHVVITSSDSKSAEAYILIYTPAFLRDINISFSAITSEVLSLPKSPTLTLEAREVAMLLRYLSLLHAVMTDSNNMLISRHIVSSLTSALFYQATAIISSRIGSSHDNAGGSSNRNNYVQDFIRLLHVYFNRERSVEFYASRLFISPKYLSLLVKKSTGRSAARWIDYFVIMEAKNLLRYSGKNVQQVAYALNFSNQSSFGKYFKHLTGLSPTEYQKQ